jgi:DNA helicase-2/ATP-dependent DNA helicase PcrA
MRERVETVTGKKLRDFGRFADFHPTICTFHSLCLRILRLYAEELGVPDNFVIYDSADQTAAIKSAIKEADVSSTNFSPAVCREHISNAKNKLQTADRFSQDATDFFTRNLAKIYRFYEKTLRDNGAVDFDDLLMIACRGLRDNPKVLAKMQDRFRYILIDEYQDTNHAQYLLAHMLAQGKRNIAVVGDPDQSIYAWRGADISNILNFEDDYPDAKIVRLERNYRSTQNILDAATALISQNTQRKDKRLYTDKGAGPKLKVVHCQEEHDEADQVARWLTVRHAAGTPWGEMAVFYRMNSLTRVMEEALRRHKVPYQIVRGTEFYNRREIKDALAYLKAIANPADEVALERIINTPTRGIGKTTINALQSFARSQSITFDAAIGRAADVPGLAARAVTAVGRFAELMQGWRELLHGKPADSSEMFSTETVAAGTVQAVLESVIRKSGLETQAKKDDPTGDAQQANLAELISSAAEFDREQPEGTLLDFLAQSALVGDADVPTPEGQVTLMTLHAAKGLEFPVVAMIGLEMDCLPHSRASGDPDQLEEERRLAFVGITRAQEHLMLSRAAVRTVRGERLPTATSMFLKELPGTLLEVEDRTGTDDLPNYTGNAQRQKSSLTPGQRVRHFKFGLGTVVDVDDLGKRATVDFTQWGKKTLMLEYAKLQAVA